MAVNTSVIGRVIQTPEHGVTVLEKKSDYLFHASLTRLDKDIANSTLVIELEIETQLEDGSLEYVGYRGSKEFFRYIPTGGQFYFNTNLTPS